MFSKFEAWMASLPLEHQLKALEAIRDYRPPQYLLDIEDAINREAEKIARYIDNEIIELYMKGGGKRAVEKG